MQLLEQAHVITLYQKIVCTVFTTHYRYLLKKIQEKLLERKGKGLFDTLIKLMVCLVSI